MILATITLAMRAFCNYSTFNMRIDYFNKSYESYKYKVLRGFMQHSSINEEELIVGDIVLLQAGESVSFDCLMVKGDQLSVSETLPGQKKAQSHRKMKFEKCWEILTELKANGTLNEDSAKLVPTPVIFAGSKIEGYCGSALVIGLGEKSSLSKLKKPSCCEVEKSLTTQWREFCRFTARYLVTSIFVCVLLSGLLIGLNRYLKETSSKAFYLVNSEALEFFLCMSVACIPLGYLKIKNDLWSRFCYRLSESQNCTFRKFDSFNKLASVDRVVIPMEDFLLRQVDQFKLVAITSGECELALSQNTKPIVELIKGKMANQILENLAILDFNGGKITKEKSSL